MAKNSTSFIIEAKNNTQQGINEATSSFKSFTAQFDSLFGGMPSKISNFITNPWTLAIAAIGSGAKVFSELTKTGIEAEKSATAMSQAFGSAAGTISDYIREVDRTTLATKDDLEGMAKSLSTYGLSAEEIKDVLQTTSDIATKTGNSFSTVESAVINALNGQDRALNKIIPEWKDYKEGADSAAQGITDLGTAIHDSAIEIQSGSISQTLDNMSSSWQNIKENLGQTIVMNIQASGVLTTIANWLSLIEENTREAQLRESLKGTLGSAYNSDYAYNLVYSGAVSVSDAQYFKQNMVTNKTSEAVISGIDRAIADLGNAVDVDDEKAYELIKKYRQLTYGSGPDAYESLYSEVNSIISSKKMTLNAKNALVKLRAKILEDIPNALSNYSGGTTLKSPTNLMDSTSEYSFADYGQALNSGVYANVNRALAAAFGTESTTTTTAGKVMIKNPILVTDSTSEYGYGDYGLAAGSGVYDWVNKALAEFLEEEKSAAAEQARIEKERKEREENILEGMSIATQSINSLSSVFGTWRDGYQSGDLGSTFSTVGSLVSTFSKTWGSGLSLLGTGIGLFEGLLSLKDVDSESSSSSSNAAQVAQYNGVTNIRINNYFEGSYIVGSGGMTELAIIMREEMTNLAYSNR